MVHEVLVIIKTVGSTERSLSKTRGDCILTVDIVYGAIKVGIHVRHMALDWLCPMQEYGISALQEVK